MTKTTSAQQSYLAYFGRPGDPVGHANLDNLLDKLNVRSITELKNAYFRGILDGASEPDQNVVSIIRNFSSSQESRNLYGDLLENSESFVRSVFLNAFGRQPASEGLTYWVNEISNGLDPAGAAIAIIAGAFENTSQLALQDKAASEKKTSAAQVFTDLLDTPPETQAYQGGNAAQIARDFLSNINAQTSSGDIFSLAQSAADLVVSSSTPDAGQANQVINLTVLDANETNPVSSIKEGQKITLVVERSSVESAETVELVMSGSKGALRDFNVASTLPVVFEIGQSLAKIQLSALNDIDIENSERIALSVIKSGSTLATTDIELLDHQGTSSVNVSIDLDNPGNLTLPGDVQAHVRAAFDYLDDYFKFGGTMDVRIVIEQTPTGRFAGGPSVVEISNNNGVSLREAAAANESKTGLDQFSSTPEFFIFIDPTTDYAKSLYWDPNISSSIDGPVDPSKVDAFSVILHELMHGMGFTGFTQAGQDPSTLAFIDLYDTHIRKTGSNYEFLGPKAVNLIGEPIELTSEGSQAIAHLGAGTPLSSGQPFLEHNLMNGYAFLFGERYQLGRLDMAMLEDVGWRMDESQKSIFTVSNEVDSGITKSRFYVGYEDRADLLIGSDFDDVLKGLGGDDVFINSLGNDRYEGGDGFDLLVMNAAETNYSLNRSEGIVSLIGVSGESEILSGIEAIEFTDRTILI